MDSWINFPDGLSIPGGKEFQFLGSRMPATPEKPIPVQSNSAPVDRNGNQMGQENSQETTRLTSQYVQEVPNYNRHEPAQQYARVDNFVVPQFNQVGHISNSINANYFSINKGVAEETTMVTHIPGFYIPDLSTAENDQKNCSLPHILRLHHAAPAASPNQACASSTTIVNNPETPNLLADIKWRQNMVFGSRSDRNLGITSASINNFRKLMFANQNHWPNFDILSGHDSLSPASQYGSPIHLQPRSNLNTPPSMENDATSRAASSVKDAINGTILESNLHAVTAKLSGQFSFAGKQCDLGLATKNGTQRHLLHEHLHKIVDSSSKEANDLEIRGSNQGNDLNKTPTQKPPKQRKHRPKVIVEGKPKRATNITTNKAVIHKEKLAGKRKHVQKTTEELVIERADKLTGKSKYVRKKIKGSATPHADSVELTTEFHNEIALKSCRRGLFFNWERVDDERQGKIVEALILNTKEMPSNWSAHSIAAESSQGANKMHGTNSASGISEFNRLPNRNQLSAALTNHIPSTSRALGNLISLEGQHGGLPIEHGQIENLAVKRRDAKMRNQHPFLVEGLGQIVLPAKNDSETIQRKGKNPVPEPTISSYIMEGRGSKRGHLQIDQINIYSSNPRNDPTMHTYEHSQFGKVTGVICPEVCRKQRVENGFDPRVCALPFCAGEDSRSEISATAVKFVRSKLQSNYQAATNFKHNTITKGQNCGTSERMGRTSILSKPQNFASKTTTRIPQISTASEDQLQSRIVDTDQSRKQQTSTLAQSSFVLCRDVEIKKQRKGVAQDYQQPSASRKGRQVKHEFTSSIEELTHQLDRLCLNKRADEVDDKEQNALVPYRGDGKIDPYEGVDLIKRRRPRPKVDLDLERVWKLLMGNEGQEGLEETDKDKKKWWDEERRVFQGRADSFIARMHLIQGDRRFSKWKGSVVDSVIGVFLTQNVSDHLSSSAFMSLAARFPLKSAGNSITTKECPSIMVKQPDISAQTWQTIKLIEELLNSPQCDQSSLALHESTANVRDWEASWIKRSFTAELLYHNQEEEVFSSQCSSDSLIIQANGGGYYIGSNSEAEDLAGGHKSNKGHSPSSTDHIPMGSILFQEFNTGTSENLLPHKRSSNGKEQPEVLVNRLPKTRFDELNGLGSSCTFDQQKNCNYPEMQKLASASNSQQATAESEVLKPDSFGFYAEESVSSWLSSSRFSSEKEATNTNKRFKQEANRLCDIPSQLFQPPSNQRTPIVGTNDLFDFSSQYEQRSSQPSYENQTNGRMMHNHLESTFFDKPTNIAEAPTKQPNLYDQQVSDVPKPSGKLLNAKEETALVDKESQSENKINAEAKLHTNNRVTVEATKTALKTRKGNSEGEKKDPVHWDSLRKKAQVSNGHKERSKDTRDSMDYEALRCASISEISKLIEKRGMNNMLAERIKEFLNRMVRDHGSIDLEWLKDVSPEKAKDYLLSIRGLGLKSAECVRLLTLHHLAFPVDTNVGRIVVRLGWVPLQTLPESPQFHLLEEYPVLESIQKYLWPRLCKLNQQTLYELHYQLITFGKVFCTKKSPNCNACPMRVECKHFASAFASARLALPGPEEKSLTTSTSPITPEESNPSIAINHMLLTQTRDSSLKRPGTCIPNVEEPVTPEQEQIKIAESDIEDMFSKDHNEVPTINLNMENFASNLQNYVQENMERQESDMSKALVVLNPNVANIPTTKLKSVSQLRTEHQVYELPDSHPLLKEMDRREPDDPSPYLLAIWTPGESSDSIQLPKQQCESHEPDKLCNKKTCFSCNSIRETNSQTIRGTILIPCRTAMRGQFPLNGTYFQVNEVFADHESSVNPIDVPRAWIWNLPRRMVYFGTSVSTILKGLSTEEIQYCFWKGFVCVRGFELKTRVPRPLRARLHHPASTLAEATGHEA